MSVGPVLNGQTDSAVGNAAYVGYLILAARQHDARPAYSSMMMSFVVPSTVVTFIVAVFRPRVVRALRRPAAGAPRGAARSAAPRCHWA